MSSGILVSAMDLFQPDPNLLCVADLWVPDLSPHSNSFRLIPCLLSGCVCVVCMHTIRDITILSLVAKQESSRKVFDLERRSSALTMGETQDNKKKKRKKGVLGQETKRETNERVVQRGLAS